jgi:DNA-binding MarR family transcriptional regulator
VVRKRGKEDKRQQIVSLTAKGKAMEEQAYAIIPAGMGKALSLPLATEGTQERGLIT